MPKGPRTTTVRLSRRRARRLNEAFWFRRGETMRMSPSAAIDRAGATDAATRSEICTLVCDG
jgi:hypothetical protein